ncbi:hypothetical protein GSI_04416 [Ganoderma sinense ZZ0214-1]|uniref:Uncharacterized protein n=1 Tax=Ganoderma sinense ZZ0214-1 TaxID=1077348 RepID=A0A2G8SJ59_9APHY|nr:hypothetical protein GSI_04416 [Ganoderma sinense ZZ0214-1]
MDTTTTVNVLQHENDALAPDFADVVYLLTTPPPITDLNKTWDLGSRISSYVALFAYSLAHPKQFALWVNYALKISESIEDATYVEVWREWAEAAKSNAVFAFCVARLFLFAPRGPEVRARELGVRSVPVRGSPEDGTVRIRWYPDLEATKRWPAGVRKLWVDVPADGDGSVDLKVVMNRWGMQNCYVIDANCARPHLRRRPVEKLSALAINVLLADGHKVIGVVECPSKPLQLAREYRAYLVHLRHQAWLLLTAAVSRVLGRAMRRLARAAFNITVYGPRFLWFFVSCSPYILFHALEVGVLFFLAFGTVVIHDLEDLGYIVQYFLAPHVCQVLGVARAWLVAGLEAAFLTDDEIRRRSQFKSGLDVSGIWTCQNAVLLNNSLAVY